MQKNDWFYQPAPPLYIGKHEKLYPAPITGGYYGERYRYATRVIHPGRMVKVPQVDLMTTAEPTTWKQIVVKIRKKIRV